MGNEHYYHMFANGDDARDFITSEEEHKAAFNRFAICQYRTGVSVLSMSVGAIQTLKGSAFGEGMD